MKRLVAAILAVLFILTIVGCGKQKREIIKLTLSTEDAEAILRAAGITLPDEQTAAGTNSTVKYLSWYDGFHNYSEDEIVNTGYFTFTEKYGCEIEWIETEWSTRFDDLANLVLSSQAPDFYPAGTSSTATYPMKCIKGMFQPVDDYIDFDSPLWSGIKEVADTFSFSGRHFTIVTNTTFRDVVPYNRRVIDEWGFDDPAELYANDEWTWDVFYSMCVEFSDPDEDRFALDGQSYTNSLVQATGQNFVHRDEDGRYYSNLDSPEIERAEQMLYDLTKNDCTHHEGDNYWAIRDNGTYGAGVKDGLCLFYICETGFFTGPVEEISSVWGDITAGELMFAPLPRDNNGDGNYYLLTQINGYNLCYGAENPEGVALLASCERFKVLDPTVVDIDRKQLEEKYLWTEEMLEMYDTCKQIAEAHPRAIVTGDMTDGLNNIVASLQYGPCRSANPSTWAQVKEENRESLEYYLEEINDMMDTYDPDAGIVA
ncbi:MAG TPA: extracellular solute-binding protein [Candidatus Faeciplasma avium]|uniref:Extracellular solute-binding protein n=1 Tax=Candidatus Faeciplasma avium TaxID=2840798 RepID=A0A9D1NQS5_9FIRM|nr:extracellular solute-binding protein [Candidatus Faeciplasma avium]